MSAGLFNFDNVRQGSFLATVTAESAIVLAIVRTVNERSIECSINNEMKVFELNGVAQDDSCFLTNVPYPYGDETFPRHFSQVLLAAETDEGLSPKVRELLHTVLHHTNGDLHFPRARK